MAILLASICFEAVGRKVLPSVPSIVFYFLKDVVLLAGLAMFGIHPKVLSLFGRLYRPFQGFLGLALIWTVVEVFNPEQESVVLGLIGLRAYWLWFLAPLVIASAIRTAEQRRQVVIALAVVGLIVGAVAAYQFAQPAESQANGYALYNGQAVIEVATVQTTGRARVSSTFSYLTGFTGFVVLIPVLLLSLGLSEDRGRARLMCLGATVLSAITMPMSGSRQPVLVGGASLLIVVWQAGYLRTNVGRRMLAGGVAAVALGLTLVPDASQGIVDRFNGSDTSERLQALSVLFAPYSLVELEYPGLGIGTGMQQNARTALGVTREDWYSEAEPGRYLIELGAPGYLVIWMARLGLAVMLLRVGWLAKRMKKRAIAGAAFAYAPLTFLGSLTFDHIYQALYCVGVGLIFQAVAWPDDAGADSSAPSVAQPSPIPAGRVR